MSYERDIEPDWHARALRAEAALAAHDAGWEMLLAMERTFSRDRQQEMETALADMTAERNEERTERKLAEQDLESARAEATKAATLLARASGLMDCYGATKRGECSADRRCPACLVHADIAAFVVAIRAPRQAEPEHWCEGRNANRPWPKESCSVCKEVPSSPPPPSRPCGNPNHAEPGSCGAWGTRRPATCVCLHLKSQHAMRDGVLSCTVKDCACGPGCIHEGFVDDRDLPPPPSEVDNPYDDPTVPLPDDVNHPENQPPPPSMEERILHSRRITLPLEARPNDRPRRREP